MAAAGLNNLTGTGVPVLGCSDMAESVLFSTDLWLNQRCRKRKGKEKNHCGCCHNMVLALTRFIFRLWWFGLFNKEPYKEENEK